MKISIIIPVYKVERYIKRCLDSIWNQNLEEDKYEVIIINDGTPDDSMDIVREYERLHHNLKIFEQANQGLSSARNKGIEEAKGEYIWFVDSDDTIVGTSLKTVLTVLKNQSSDLFIFPINRINEKGNHIGINELDCKRNNVMFSGIDYFVNYNIITPMQRYLIRKELIITHNIFFKELIYHEDVELAPKILFYAKSITPIHIPLYNYRIRDNSITTSCNIKHLTDLIWIMEQWKRVASSLNNNDVYKSKLSIHASKYAFYILKKLHNIPDKSFRHSISKKLTRSVKKYSINKLRSEPGLKILLIYVVTCLNPYWIVYIKRIEKISFNIMQVIKFKILSFFR